jgi:hypothetical protein
MKRLLYAFLLAVLAASLSSGQVVVTQNIAAAGPIQTGFAQITPTDGSGIGLSVSEILRQQIDANIFQASVQASPLVTLTDVFVSVDVFNGINTGVAIVNPTAASATVALSLLNQSGVVIGATTITLGPRQQISRFVTQIFPGVPDLTVAMSGLMFVSSDVPVSVMGLSFNGPSFVSLPVSAQLDTTNGVIANSAITGTVAVVSPTTFATATTASVAASAAAATTPLVLPGQIMAGQVLPGQILAGQFLPGQGVTSTNLAAPSNIIGLPQNIIGIAPTIPITGITTPQVTSTGVVTTGFGAVTTAVTPNVVAVTTPNVVAVATPNVNAAVVTTTTVTAGALVLPQVATGGGWVSSITIANTSTTPQTVRIDFFNSIGGPLVLPFGSSVASVIVPAGGVAVVSTGL